MRVIKGKKIAIIAIFMVFMIGGICFARQMNKKIILLYIRVEN